MNLGILDSTSRLFFIHSDVNEGSSFSIKLLLPIIEFCRINQSEKEKLLLGLGTSHNILISTALSLSRNPTI